MASDLGRWPAGAALALFLVAGLPAVGAAQQGGPDAARPLATRTELEGYLARMTPALRASSTGRAIQDRLTNGDLQAGDKVLLHVSGDSSLSGTFTIRPERTLVLPSLQPISMKGVLRSELEDYLRREIGRFLREPIVQASSLVRVAIVGEVMRPGFLDLAPESPASESIVAAGGMTGGGDLYKTVVRRNGEVIFDQAQMRDIFAKGISIDQMNLHGGDEIVIGRRKQGTNVLAVVGALGGASALIFGIANLVK